MMSPTAQINAFRSQLAPDLLTSQPWWVAYSGGLDSTALLMACVAIGLPVRAVHVNHHLQQAAEAMQGHCESFCAEHGIALDVLHVQVQRQGGESLEAQARLARYQLIGQHVMKAQAARLDAQLPPQLAAQSAPQLVLTGHHQDDQLETVLIALFRGSGLNGLSGMQALSDWPVPSSAGLRLGRPLLGLPRAALQAWLVSNDWVWFDDPTNQDPSLRRNAMRLSLLPQIREWFPQVDASVARLSRQVTALRHEWAQSALQDLSEVGTPDGGIKQELLLALPAERQARLVRMWLQGMGVRMNESQTVALLDQLQARHGGLRRVAGMWSLTVRRGVIRLTTGGPDPSVDAMEGGE